MARSHRAIAGAAQVYECPAGLLAALAGSLLDRVVALGQRAARCLRPGRLRDGLHGVWLGHPLHPVLAQGAVGAWLSAPDGPDGRGRPPGWPATQGGFEAAVIRLLND